MTAPVVAPACGFERPRKAPRKGRIHFLVPSPSDSAWSTARQRPWSRVGVYLGVGAALLAAQLSPPALHAAPTIENLRYVLDIDSNALGTLLEDHLAADQSFVPFGAPTAQDLGVPAAAAIDAYVLLDDGAQVISVDTTVQLGGLLAEPGDLVRFNDGVWSLEADAGALGLTSAADLDAVWAFESLYVVSFDISGEVGGIAFDDEDLLVVESDGAGWSVSADFDALFFFLQGGFDVQAVHYKLSETPLFCDGFESRDTSAWSTP